ncbi:MAG: hypothetical protein UY63_C0011G0015 [Parcubacteria group bacterium GW2011_GWA2_51_10]|nr:MAG: hypothetical protein UY63_C0011G0015 [Parcubacteria group bacterium GW2011_GWA2_51_10]
MGYTFYVKKKRATDCEAFLAWRNTCGFANISVTATLSIVVLLGAFLWQLTETISAKNDAPVANTAVSGAQSGVPEPEYAALFGESASGSRAGVSGENLASIGTSTMEKLIGSYVALKNEGSYTPEDGERIAGDLAQSLRASVSYEEVRENSLKTHADTSYTAMLAYRSNMRVALEPLLENTESELAIFGRYVETGDKENLSRLSEVAARYGEAAARAQKLVVPKDALRSHASVVNSLLRFEATLNEMTRWADDPMAALALLRAYNSSEAEVFASFNTLAAYQKKKTP